MCLQAKLTATAHHDDRIQAKVFSTYKVASAHEHNEILLGVNLDFLSQ